MARWPSITQVAGGSSTPAPLEASVLRARAGRICKTGPQLEAGAACVLLAQATETEAPAPSVKQPEIAQPQSSVELAGRHS